MDGDKQNDQEIWNSIVEEYEKQREGVNNFIQSKRRNTVETRNPEWCFMEQEVFPTLIPALNSMIFKARLRNLEKINVSRFNPIDHLAELLWNFNPKYPDRYSSYKDIFEIPWVSQYLENNPRPLYKKWELWTNDFAAAKIQACYRGYLVRKLADVQEMRQFWKDLKFEREHEKSLQSNSTEEVKPEILECPCNSSDHTACYNPKQCFESSETSEMSSRNSLKTVTVKSTDFFQ